jgi:beta-lactamase class A
MTAADKESSSPLEIGSAGGAQPRHARATQSWWQSPRILLAVIASAIVLAAAVVASALTLTQGPGGKKAPSAPAAAAASRESSSATPKASSSPSPSASPHTAAAEADPLAAAQSYLATRSGTVLAAVYDAKSRQLWTVGAGKPQAEASIVKLDILETLLAQHRAAGTALSAEEMSLAAAMIEDSDNDAATSLWDDVDGAAGIGAYNRSAGLRDTTPSTCVECSGFPWPGWGLTTTTAVDQIVLLRELLEPSSLLTAAQQQYALGLMRNVTESQRWGVTGGVPTQLPVALKNGWLPLTSSDTDWQINSIGWINGDGRDYLMAVLTTGDPTEQYGIDTINQLSAMVWGRLP